MAGRLMDKVEKAIVACIHLEELRKISKSFCPGRELKGVLPNTSYRRYGLGQLVQLYFALRHAYKLDSSFRAREC
jgi:hypothetical protein